jgi:hypothetical protein
MRSPTSVRWPTVALMLVNNSKQLEWRTTVEMENCVFPKGRTLMTHGPLTTM